MGKSSDLRMGLQLHPTIEKEATNKCTKKPTRCIAGTEKLRKKLIFKYKGTIALRKTSEPSDTHTLYDK